MPLNSTLPLASSQKEKQLLEALKIAYQYLPDLKDVNALDYAGVMEQLKKEINQVRKALIDNGCDPDKIATPQ
jgi:hypothetical protein